MKLIEIWPALLDNKLLFLGTSIIIIEIMIAIFVGFLPLPSPIQTNASLMLKSPNLQHIFGTDQFGREVFVRILYGTRISLIAAFASIGIALITGGILGLISGYFGGIMDHVFGRIMDILFSFPPIILALALAATLGSGLTNVIIAIAVVYTPLFFRISRGSTLGEKERDYIQAAIAMGASNFSIMVKHITRNIQDPLIVQTAVSLSYAILLEAALSFLGLGVQPPQPSWGTILNGGKTYLEIAPWISIFPGIFIMVSIMAFNLIADGLRDILDPKTRTEVRI